MLYIISMCISALGLKGISNPFSHDIQVLGEDGVKKTFNPKFVLNMIENSCQDLTEPWKIEQLYSRIEATIYGGITENEIIKITLDTASFYAKYDPEFKVVSKKLSRQLSPQIRPFESKAEKKMKGFAQLKVVS